jgi:UbiD family decarboxylase
VGHQSLGEFIEAADAVGEVRVVEGADRDRDIGCLTELSAEMNGPLLLFQGISGFDPDFKICSNLLKTPKRFALAMGFPLDAHPVELVRLWREKRKSLQVPIPPQVVSDGPIFECVQEGDDVDLDIFPTPRWHDRDGGRYIGTGDVVVIRDPDGGWVNLGTYRGQVQGRDRMTLWIIGAKHGRILLERYWARGEAAPIAVVLGCDPLTWMSSSMAPPFGTSEYEFAGAHHGEPVQVVNLPLTGLPVPAQSEIVLEGEVPPISEESAHEGPFGEWPGYYSHEGQEPVVRVKRIYHRKRPILLGAPPLRPMGFASNCAIPTSLVQLWEHLERGGVTDIAGVWGFGNTLMLVVALRQRYAGHAKQALLTMAGFRSGAGMYGQYVVVDDDIDPSNLEEVVWAISTRADPATSVEIIRGGWTADLDPRIPPDKRAANDLTVGRMLIDACRPFAWKDKFAPTNVFDPEKRKDVNERWSDLLEDIRMGRPQRVPANAGLR